MLRRSNSLLNVGVLAVVTTLYGAGWVCAQETSRAVEAGDQPGAPAGVPAGDRSDSQPDVSEPAAHGEAGAGGAGHAAPAAINPLKLETKLSVWTLVVFLGLLAVLRKYAWTPLITALHQREEHLEHVLLETERSRNESEALLAEHRKQMARAADEVRSIMDKGRQEAQAAALQLIQQAQGEAEAARQRASREIAAARDQALAEIWQKTAEISVAVAGRVLRKELKPDEQRRLLDSAIAELPSVALRNGHGESPQ
jgi:F-type H+-transporting ATPase subunit b